MRTAERGTARTFLERPRGRYDVVEAIMFGSRARGDHRADSDLDLAIVLNGERGDFIGTKLDMAGVAFDVLMETGILVQPFPLWRDDMSNSERSTSPEMIGNIVRDGIRVE